MDWSALIQRLITSGLTQTQIADRCRCTQSAISDLQTGKTLNPSYALGKALTDLDAATTPTEA